MPRVVITTNQGELVEMLEEDDLPSKATPLSSQQLASAVWTAIVRARQLEEKGRSDDLDRD